MRYRFAHLAASTVFAAACFSVQAQEGVIRFEISRFDVRGNTLLAEDEVARVLAPYTGRQRDFGDVQRALEALEAAFHARGYQVVTVELPEQELERGVVRLNVVQTRIGRVAVKNNRYFDEANVRRALPGLQEGRTPNLPQVSNSLKLANENPARKLSLKLQSGEQHDEVDAAVEVADEKPWKAMFNADNSGTRQTGRTHLGFVLQHANLWGRDHVASLQYTTTAEEPGRVKVYGLGYHIPLYAQGDALDLYASYSNIDSGNVAAGVLNLAVSGKGAVYGARYTHNLAKRGDYESKLVYGLDIKAFKNSVQFEGHELGNDVTVHPLSLTYAGDWTLPQGELDVSATVLHNMPGGSRGGQADFTHARIGARDNYNILRLGLSYSRVLPRDWQLRAIVNGQYSSDALIPGEQFGAGGAGSVRGFAERELSNDVGVNANLELYTPNLCGGEGKRQCRLLAFYDSAYLKRNKALAGELRSTSIGSAGLGLRLLLSTYASLQLDYGHVLKEGATARSGGNRLHVRLGLAY
ncbi:BamA/TamA family outer membrane protein [Massilia sp. MB5]|uniref:ShlB/FhaC/HecB family hemolysin secretion/activation protein n=1 Tax=Massilia sp. MB5 TaxID=2919578 RepID=UPI001F100DDB|nr:ShlB/FhaC/HecB family hemolysin secretion/activation protein [Massilia sp. MB5]UMR30570.1 BamA/TamA family outer membrane protein [Massilia sp. MB5]